MRVIHVPHKWIARTSRAMTITVIIFLMTGNVYADDIVSIKNQPQQPFEPLGLKAGSFLAHPAMHIEEHYDDNIFATDDNEESDFITALKPSISVNSNWSRHALTFAADGVIGRYADNSAEDYEDYGLELKGRYDITHETFIDAKLSYRRDHEDRSSPTDANGDQPTDIDTASARLGFTRALGRLKLYLHGALEDLEFDNNTAGGVLIDNSFRNRLQKEAGLKLAYEFKPGTQIFTAAMYNDRDYDSASSPDRSSDGNRLRVGLSHNITGKLKGEAYAGTISQNYGAGFKDVNTADYGASLLWNLSGLTSLSAELDRNVYETTSAGVSGYIRTQGALNLEHAFLQNLIAQTGLSFAKDNYVGTNRDDDIIKAGAELAYKPFRGMETVLRYDYAHRNSNLNSQDFGSHRLMLRLGYAL